jgi:hypothetical protein
VARRKKRTLFVDEGGRSLVGRDVFPALVRPAAMRLLWTGLLLVLVSLLVLLVLLARIL